jgi:hypothetical protein
MARGDNRKSNKMRQRIGQKKKKEAAKRRRAAGAKAKTAKK